MPKCKFLENLANSFVTTDANSVINQKLLSAVDQIISAFESNVELTQLVNDFIIANVRGVDAPAVSIKNIQQLLSAFVKNIFIAEYIKPELRKSLDDLFPNAVDQCLKNANKTHIQHWQISLAERGISLINPSLYINKTLATQRRIENVISSFVYAQLNIAREYREINYEANQLRTLDFGNQACEAYLSTLDREFTSELQRGEQKGRLTLYLPQQNVSPELSQRIDIEILQILSSFLTTRLSQDAKYLFPCENLFFNVKQLLCTNEKINSMQVLCDLIKLLDNAGLNILVLGFKYINDRQFAPDEIYQLASTIKLLKSLQIKFSQDSLPFDKIIQLEGISDQCLRKDRFENSKQLHLLVKQISANPQTISSTIVSTSTHNVNKKPSRLDEKRQELDQEEILLPLTVQTPGLQRQHQVERTLQQQQQVTTQQAWQRDVTKNTSKEVGNATSAFYGDETKKLITREQIIIAINKNHPHYLEVYETLGKQICNYNYMGRNLLDLWDRICDKDNDNVFRDGSIQYSFNQIRRMTTSALSEITSAPHDFQFGVNLTDLASGFAFTYDGGILFQKEEFKSESNLAAKMLQPEYPSELSSYYYDDIVALYGDNYPFNVLFDLSILIGAYDAWRLYSRYFAVISHFELLNKQSFLVVAGQLFNSNYEQKSFQLEYLLAVYQFYFQYLQKMRTPATNFVRKEFEAWLSKQFYSSNLKFNHYDLCKILEEKDREHIFKSAISFLQACDFNEINSIAHNKRFLQFLIAMIKRDDPLFANRIMTDYLPIINEMNSINLLALIHTVNSNGTTAANVLLESFLSIYRSQGKNGFLQFQSAFLNPLATFVELLTPEAMNCIVRLLKLNTKELNWWYSLTQQHIEQSGYGNFVDLLNGFNDFLTKLKEMKVYEALPFECPLQGVGHLKIGLYRLLTLLRNAINPAEQLANLEGISLNVTDAVYASTVGKYQLVAKEMQLTFADELNFGKLMKSKNSTGYTSLYGDYDISLHRGYQSVSEFHIDLYRYTITCFYRFLGKQTYISTYSYYRDYVANLEIPPYWHIASDLCMTIADGKESITYREDPLYITIVKLHLLAVIAFATTGKRNMEVIPTTTSARKHELSAFIESLLQLAKYRNSSEKWQNYGKNLVEAKELNQLLENFKRLKDCEVRPTLVEMTYLLHLINSSVERAYQYLGSEATTAKVKQWHPNELLTRIDNQCLYAMKYIEKYKLDFVRAIEILHERNTQSYFAYFLQFIAVIEALQTMEQTKRRLIRIVSLMYWHGENYQQQVTEFTEFMQALTRVARLKSEVEMALFLASLSQLYPDSESADLLSFPLLTQFLQKCLDVSVGKSFADTVTSLIKSGYFKYYSLKVDPADVQDPSFYNDEFSLEKDFPGLGQYYNEIKILLLNNFNVENNNDRVTHRNAFLTNIKALSIAYPQDIKKLLLTLSHSHLHDSKLTCINKILTVINEYTRYYPALPVELLAGLNHVLVNRMDYAETVTSGYKYLEFFSHWVKNNDSLLTLKRKHKILQLAGLLAPRQNYHDWLNELISVCDTILRCSKNQHHLQLLFDQIFTTLIAIVSNVHHVNYFNSVIQLFQAIYFKNISKNIQAGINQSNIVEANDLSSIICELFQQYQTNPEILVELEGANNLTCYLDVILITARAKIDTSVNMLAVINFMKKLSAADIKQIVTLYLSPPFPQFSRLMKLVNGEIALPVFIQQNITDPHLKRDVKALIKQFDSGRAYPYFKKILFIDEVVELTDIIANYYLQLVIVNKIGCDHIRFMTMAQIKSVLQQCRDQLTNHKSALSKDEVLCMLLISLAALREALYRCSNPNAPMWASPVQMLVTICHINHSLNGHEPIFFKIATGEGKSLIAAWEVTIDSLLGGSANMLTHHSGLAFRDHQAYQLFFEVLGLSSGNITAQSKPVEYYPEGIHYAEAMAFALFRQSVLLDTGLDIPQLNKKENKADNSANNKVENIENKAVNIEYKALNVENKPVSQLPVIEHHKTNRVSFVIDEADEIILHNEVDCNLTTSKQESSDIHPFAWVFDFLIDYLQDKITQKSNSTNGFMVVKISEIKAALLKKYVQSYTEIHSEDFRQLLKSWVRSAWTALHLQEKRDYLIKTMEVEVNGVVHLEGYAAVIINAQSMPPNVTYSESVQQCLHTILNNRFAKEKNPLYFKIATDKSLYSSMNFKALLDWALSLNGNVVVMSATIGSAAERAEMRKKYGFRFIEIPTTEEPTRKIKPDYFCKNQEEQFIKIADNSSHYTSADRIPDKRHAIILPVENIQKADDLAAYLRADIRLQDTKIHVFHAAMDNVTDARMAELEDQSAESGAITIATSGIIKRGFDPQPKPHEKHQVVVLRTYNESEATTEQEVGRCARVNKFTGKRRQGKSFGIYNLADELKRHVNNKLDPNDAFHHPERFKAMQYLAQYFSESSRRIFHEIEGEAFNTIQNGFNSIWYLCKIITEKLNDEYASSHEPELAQCYAEFKQYQEEMIERYSMCLTALMSAKPSVNNSQNTAKNKPNSDGSEMSDRLQKITDFNQLALSTWCEWITLFYTKLDTIFKGNKESYKTLLLGMKPDFNHLMLQIQNAQSKIIAAEKEGRDVGVENINKFKIYPKWEPALGNLPAHLAPGNQSFFRSLASAATERFLLKNEDKTLLQTSREQEKQLRLNERQKRWQFTSLAEGYLPLSDENNSKMAAMLNIIKHRLPAVNVMQAESAAFNLIKKAEKVNDVKSVFKEGCAKIFFNGYNYLSLSFDPFVLGYKIVLCTTEIGIIRELEQVVIDVLSEKEYAGDLVISVNGTQPEAGKQAVTIELDFTGKNFRHLNRVELLLAIAPKVRTIAREWGALFPDINKYVAFPIPTLQLQQSLLTDLKSIRTPELVKILPALTKIENALLLENNISIVFNEIIAQARKFKKDNLLINVLVQIGSCYVYLDRKNKYSIAYPPAFTNLNELLMNNRKQKIVKDISDHINRFLTGTELLPKLQKNCFFELLEEIIDSAVNMKIEDIYNAWANKKLKYEKVEMSYRDLMSKKLVGTSLFQTHLYGDEFCKKIEATIQQVMPAVVNKIVV